MKRLEDIVKELSTSELKESFVEISSWMMTGVLKDGVVRRVHAEWEKEIGTECSLRTTEGTFLYEMANRWFNISQ